MRKILFIIGMLVGFVACNDDEVSFDVPVEFRKDLEFKPIPGGAVMKYYLRENSGVFRVRVSYKDAYGLDLAKEGSYLSDSMVLLGFTEARQNVPAFVTFLDNDMKASEPLEVAFNTLPSTAYSIFDNLTVDAFWNGFSVGYSLRENMKGMAHIFYIGTNPLTHQPDSILMLSTPIVKGGDTLNFELKQNVGESVRVVVRTEDSRGYRVKQEIYEVPCLIMDTLTPADFDFRFTGNIVTNEEYQLGERYLFDGDKNGDKYRKNLLENRYTFRYSTFMAGPNAFNERFILDLREPKVPASVNLYAFLNFHTLWPFASDYEQLVKYPDDLIEFWQGNYRGKLPCKVKLYGTNADPESVNLSSCKLLYELDNGDSFATWQTSWAARTDEQDGTYRTENWLDVTDDEYALADPVVLKMLCNYSGEKYRYLIFVVEDTYHGGSYGYGDDGNRRKYISFNELEVCVKAE
ncbi:MULTISPECIES: DUF4959 domain-containing protein [Butyricimonas]|uniref:DUF4959 domain-containing protein n=1 Tax=Butyricimonas TaxID=574697 RepID=UPI0007FB328E|nr:MULTISPECIES: DUF4959 domain-containing protein [Butyricimonas]